MVENNSDDHCSKMGGWQINSYTGINDFKFTSDITTPKIKKPSEVLVKVISASLNQIDERITG